jgi:UDP-N-acetylglucosamine 2-epimerase (non-hydrolysing)
VLLTPSRDGDENLVREGVPAQRIHFVGNVMIDSLLRHRERAPWNAVRSSLGLEEHRYAVLTLHRPANVDRPDLFRQLLGRLREVAAHLPIVFPIHPRTARRLDEHGLLNEAAFLRTTDPLGYLDFLALLDHAACALTDSGGIQEETTVLGVPCFTLRDNTERPVTITQGTNTLVGADARGLQEAFAQFLHSGGKRGCVPELWDGAAGQRVADVLVQELDAIMA